MFYVQSPAIRRWIQKTISVQNEGGGSCLWLRFVLLAAVANEGCQYPEQPRASGKPKNNRGHSGCLVATRHYPRGRKLKPLT